MTSRERVRAAFEGRAVDLTPVFASYAGLYIRDHFDELTGRPLHHYHKWLCSSRRDFIETYRQIDEVAPFDVLHPPGGIRRAHPSDLSYEEVHGKAYVHNRRTGTRSEVRLTTRSGHADDVVANQEAIVRDLADVREKVTIRKAEDHVRDGSVERVHEIVEAFGEERFVVTGHVVGTIYGCAQYVGQTRALLLLLDDPVLMTELCKRHTEKNIEWIRAFCTAGGDAVFIDDAMATSEMISVLLFEQFCLPYMKQLVDEIHANGLKVFVVYFGGVMDRLGQIASLGADGLAVEASMKGYVNDLGKIADRVGDRMTLFGNVNPYDHLECLSEEGLEAVMRQQATAGRRARGYVAATGSPITMGTPLERVQRFIELGHAL